MLVAEIREHLQHIGNVFERACDSMGLKINVEMSKVLVVKSTRRGSCEKVKVSGKEMRVAPRVLEGRKVWGGISGLAFIFSGNGARFHHRTPSKLG